METLWQDIRYGFRMLLKRPGFTLVAVLSLALGIGANAAIFSLVKAVLIAPLPFHEPERLVMIWEDASSVGFPRNTPAPANYVDWKTQNQTFEDMAAILRESYNLTGDGEPQRVEAYAVTANFFPLLGVAPLHGRTFTPEEDTPGAERAVVLSYGLWRSRYAADASIVGREILLNDQKVTVIGVMPSDFQFLNDVNIWVPAAFTPQELAARTSHYLTVVGRVKPGVTLEQAQADIKSVMQKIKQDFPDQTRNIDAFVVPLREELAGEVRTALIVLLAAVGCVLLIACANIANLLLARATARRKEIAVRTALGAGRARIVRQLLTESVLLAALGGAFGLVFASWSFGFLKQLIPERMAALTGVGIDMQVFFFALLLSMATGIIFGLAPALQAAKLDLNDVLKQSGARAGIGAGAGRLRSFLVISEVALALVLLVGAGLMIQTFIKLRTLDVGFRSENVLSLRTALPRNRYPNSARRAVFYQQVLERVRALPGVVSAGYVTSVPLDNKGGTTGFTIEGVPPGADQDANHRQVSAEYFQTIGIPLKEGRYFTEHDGPDSLPVAIVNETMAEQFWPGAAAIGKRFKIGGPDSPLPWITIVGIVGDVKQMGLEVPVKAEMYLPHNQIDIHPFYAPHDLVIRASGDPLSLVAAVRQEVWAVDPMQPISDIRTMDDVLDKEVAQRRMSMSLLAAFAALALLLAALGIYGVLSYTVTQRTQEIGVRMALGAQPKDVLLMVVWYAMRLALVGVGIGLAVAFLLTRLMSSILFGISASDPSTFIAISLLLALVALAASLIPARRAMKVDPMIALRYE